ncbi:uncharacterized protein LOC123011395 [Tribolium madens]|uniref:uncharacterized protein LOC123011395 n=1 Tax=Tribolium madens TaxID=41895 RepID=UPI001CF7513B|nr:uncharacterized protein LOC123011395 [Tribolium madens]
MKKYHQLMLLIISIVSLSLFLIYRHEYNRLHYVLEVFNFFGQPCNISDLQQTENILSHHDWGPSPVWQEHESGYIYSAFLTRQNEAKALTLLSDEKLVPRNCYFWFEDKKKAIIGKFKFSKVMSDENVRLNLYFYICEMSNSEHVPYAVSFSYKTRKDSELKKIMLTNSFNHQVHINTTICVSPSIYSKRRLVEFISYHKLIGIDSFIFYNRDVPHRLVKIITNLSTRLGLQATFLPWNFPKGDSLVTRSIVENDCLLRTFGQTLYAVTLELNEYIVPLRSYSFNNFLKNVDSESGRMSLPVQKFCIENTDTAKPISMVNTDVSDDFNYNIVRYVYKNNQRKEDLSTHVVDKGYATIHKYVRCSFEPSKTRKDKSILKFSTDLTRATLFQLLLHNQI